LLDDDHPERAENLLTAVRRDLRGRGIARALKQHTLRCATNRGLTQVYTWTQTENEAMQQLNRSLGYVDRDVIVSVRASLPLGSSDRVEAI
jgi:mycothiol synthase